MIGKVPALLSKIDNRHFILVLALGSVLFLDLPFNGQAVTVPSRDINGIMTHHLLRPGNRIFQDLVQCVTDMQIAIGVRRTIMKNEFFPSL